MVLSPIDYVIIALYFIVIVSVGFVAMRFTKTKEDYLVAGRRLSFPLFFGCMAALALGGGSTVGSAQLGYEYGFGGIWLNLSIGLGLILAGFLVTSKLSRLRALSVNEVVESSYGPTARIFSSALTLVYTLTLSVVQVISIGTIINGVLGLNATLSMVLGGGIVIVYTMVGGMWSVTMTDIVQFVVKTIGILILAPLFCISAAGGWDALMAKVPETFLSAGSMGFDKSFAYVVLYVPGLIIGQDIWQRIFTAKNEKVSKRGTIGAGIYSILYAFATVIIGMSVAVLLPHLDNSQNSFVTGIATFLPVGVRGLVLAAAMAATMSVSSGTILASSTILYNDLFLRFVRARPRATGGSHGSGGMSEVNVTRAFAALSRRRGHGVLAVDQRRAGGHRHQLRLPVGLRVRAARGQLHVEAVQPEGRAVRARRERRGGDGMLPHAGHRELDSHRGGHGLGPRDVRGREPGKQAEGGLAVQRRGASSSGRNTRPRSLMNSLSSSWGTPRTAFILRMR